ncbi:hypothetical protein [Qipengyuania sp.]|uniref:hypothetical protein n=1 Tax=Qipengyuania sp. TaxID=2004515 RepID=UPI0035C8625E
MALPPYSEIAFLVGKEVARIAFETSGIHFIWWGGGEIHAMKDFEHKDLDGARHKLGDVFRDPPSMLPRLIQRKIEGVQVEESALNLIFDDGQELSFTATDLGENGLIQFTDDLADGWIVF